MATYDAAYCLTMFNRMTGRPSSDSITDATKYQRLTEAQNQVIADAAAITPTSFYSTAATASLPTMTVSAARDIATFGTGSNGYSITPIGKVTLYASLNDIPTNPLIENVDYLPMGGTTIRALNNGALPSTIYWLGITNPSDIDATHQPSLFPEASRELIAIRAAYNFAIEGNRNPDLAGTMGLAYGRPLSDQPGRFAYWCLTWKTQFKQGGALANLTGAQVAAGSAYNANAGF